MTYYGAIEAGGTKFVLAVADQENQIIAQVSLPTETPEKTLSAVQTFFKQYSLKGLGVGSFGPLDLDPKSSTYGWITNTPKVDWQFFDLLSYLKQHICNQVTLTTDVNASCLGEYLYGAAKHVRSCLYYTVGTGVGAGAINQGTFVQGAAHPEMGHVIIRRMDGDDFEGICPFHGDCLEGMVSGPALEKRTGKLGKLISKEDEHWTYVANYLAQSVYNASLTLDPEVILFGGGVFKQTHLLPRIKSAFDELNHEYKKIGDQDSYLRLAALNDQQGVLGCLALAKQTERPLIPH